METETEMWYQSGHWPLVGAIATVKGIYELESHNEGKVSIFLTQTEGDGRSSVSPMQQFEVKKGKGNFEVTIEIQHEGYLHVTFYPSKGGSGFGGVYFGKSKQMKKIEDWTLDWYLRDEVVLNDSVNQRDRQLVCCHTRAPATLIDGRTFMFSAQKRGFRARTNDLEATK